VTIVTRHWLQCFGCGRWLHGPDGLAARFRTPGLARKAGKAAGWTVKPGTTPGRTEPTDYCPSCLTALKEINP
jgi:hypothetical protein